MRGQPSVRECAEHQSDGDHHDHRRRNPGGGGGLGVDPRRGLLVELLRVGQDLLLHQRRGFRQVRRTDRVAHPVVGSRRLDQPGVDGQPRVDPAEQLHQRLVGQPAGGAGDRHGRVGDRLLVALAHGPRLGAGDECGGRGGVGHRQRGVELAGGECQRLGVVEHRGQLFLTIVDGRRGGERAEQSQVGQDDADGQDAAGGGPEEPPARVSGLSRRPPSQRLGGWMCQLNGHLARTSFPSPRIPLELPE